MKNGMLYVYMGSETFVDVQNNGDANGTITVGYSTKNVQCPFSGIIGVTNVRYIHDQR